MTDSHSSSHSKSLVGTVIAGRYEVVSELGAGGMGVVLRARQIAMNREVALKLLHPQFSQNRQAAARFIREMQVTSKLEHANTIRVYDFGETEDGQLYLAMELVPGRTLSELLEAQPVVSTTPRADLDDLVLREGLPLPRLVHIARQIAVALKAAHGEGIVHRDLKPDNVMLIDRYGDKDTVKVLDFGIARFADEDAESQRLTAEGAVVGTPAYMSPEQATGRPVGAATDLYAFGVMLFEMATGTIPFSAPTTVSLMVKHVQEAPPRPSAMAPVDARLERLILRCLAKEPADRPASAEVIIAELDKLAAPPAPKPTHAPAPAPAARPRSKLPLLLALLVLVGVGVALVFVLGAKGGAGEVPVAAVTPPAADTHTASTPDVAAEPLAPDVAAAPDLAIGSVADDVAPAGDAEDVAPSEDADDVAPSEDAAPEVEPEPQPAPRVALEALYEASGEPLPPEPCRAGEPALVAALTTAAELMRARGPEEPAVEGADAAALAALAQVAQADPDLFANATEAQALYARAVQRVVDGGSPPEGEPLTLADALAPARRATELCPEWGFAHNVMGNVQQAMKDLDEARRAYTRASTLAPGWGVPRFNLALVELASRQPVAAIAVLDRLLTDHPEWERAHMLRAQARLMAGDAAAYPLAEADALRATELAPQDGRAFFMLGEARRAQRLGEAAKEAYCVGKALGHDNSAKFCP